MKKLISLLLIFVLAAVSTAGCKLKNSANEGTAESIESGNVLVSGNDEEINPGAPESTTDSATEKNTETGTESATEKAEGSTTEASSSLETQESPVSPEDKTSESTQTAETSESTGTPDSSEIPLEESSSEDSGEGGMDVEDEYEIDLSEGEAGGGL